MHTVYMVMFEDGYLYTGMTKNTFRRNKQHFQKRGKPTVIFKQRFETQAEAVQREKQLKGWSRAKKLAAAEGRSADLVSLAKRRAGKPLPANHSIPGSYESLGRGAQ